MLDIHIFMRLNRDSSSLKDAHLEGVSYSQDTDSNCLVPKQGNLLFKLPDVEFTWIENQPLTQNQNTIKSLLVLQ